MWYQAINIEGNNFEVSSNLLTLSNVKNSLGEKKLNITPSHIKIQYRVNQVLNPGVSKYDTSEYIMYSTEINRYTGEFSQHEDYYFPQKSGGYTTNVGDYKGSCEAIEKKF